MAKRKRAPRREPAPTADYEDADGNVLRLRLSLSPGTVKTIRAGTASGAASAEDDWRRRTEMLFERLAVSWEIAGLPLTDQGMLLGRYRMADSQTQEWVRRTIAGHVRDHLPELAEG